MQNGEEAYQCPTHINCGLHDIGPDDGGESAFKGVNQSERCDDGDGSHFACAECDRHNNGHGVNADSFGRSAREKKKCGGQRTEMWSKTLLDELIRRVKVSAEIMRQQNEADENAAGEISEDHLQERKVRVVSKAGDADDRERAGFRSDDRKHDGPPGNTSVGEEIIFERLLAFAEAESE